MTLVTVEPAILEESLRSVSDSLEGGGFYRNVRLLDHYRHRLSRQALDACEAAEQLFAGYLALTKSLSSYCKGNGHNGSIERLCDLLSLYGSTVECLRLLSQEPDGCEESLEFMISEDPAKNAEQIIVQYCAGITGMIKSGSLRSVKDLNNMTAFFANQLYNYAVSRKDDYAAPDLRLSVRLNSMTFNWFSFKAEEQPVITESFDDVIGADEAINALKHAIDLTMLFNPADGMPNPAGEFANIFFLTGRPGCGKTKIMRAAACYAAFLAHRYERPFVHADIGCEVKNKYFGESERLMREGLEKATCPETTGLITLDDIDLTFMPRTSLANHPTEMGLGLELMRFLSGVNSKRLGNWIMIAASNYPGLLDPALLSRLSEFRFFVNGPETNEDYTRLLRIELREALSIGYASLTNQDLEVLGKISRNHNLSGRDVHLVCSKVMAMAKSFEIPEAVYRAGYEERQAGVARLAGRIDFDMVCTLVREQREVSEGYGRRVPVKA
ncbi:hypothetical protein AUJ69_02805 [Candidatus Woesearchaeota archaeon CG1_02_47_18]|nr:MAG: hypothetical protein AUJ69_02805 [Candidatus Woesearchaeota archaeon CG1_02_47_18]HII30145.1 AAA family ATPase [Candidatus Woesearchaeota archaeon]